MSDTYRSRLRHPRVVTQVPDYAVA